MSRQKMHPTKRKRVVSVSITQEIRDEVDKIAEETYIPRSVLYERALIAMYIRPKKKRTYKRKKGGSK